MMYINKQEIIKQCGKCNDLKIKISKKGNEYYFCDNYNQPCFKCIFDCKREKDKALLDEEKAIDNMEKHISLYESDFTGEYSRGW